MHFDTAYVRELIDELRSKGVFFAPGLTDEEINRIEAEYATGFPLDLRMFLQCALPISAGFPNWRRGWVGRDAGQSTAAGPFCDLNPISGCLEWPAKGICFDIEHNGFWMDAWGPKVSDLSTSLGIARTKIAQMPKLVPVFSHRYMPTEPAGAGNPIFSICQTDIIYYGNDLADYFAREFWVSRPNWAANEPREIRFWSSLAG